MPAHIRKIHYLAEQQVFFLRWGCGMSPSEIVAQYTGALPVSATMSDALDSVLNFNGAL
jgi:hypothetical protein